MLQKRRGLLERLSIAYLGIIVLWSVVMRGAEFHWLSTLVLYAPQHVWLPVPLVLLLIALFRRNRKAAMWNLASLALMVPLLMGFRLPWGRVGAMEPGISLRVMTFNMHHASAGLERVVETIRRQNPDIVCLQEANTGNWRSELPAQMDSLMPGWHIVRFRELATLSRYPIVSQKVHRMQEHTGRVVLETVIDIEGIRLVVLNTHLSTATKGSLFHRTVPLSEYVRDTVSTRSSQVSTVKEVAASTKGAVVVMGDFNNPPRGVLYNRMLRQFDDAFRQAGLGFGHTYHRRAPVLRIDYVFMNDRLGARRCFAPKTSSSDHRPVVADLVILGSDTEE